MLDNPNDDIMPDFMTGKYEDARARLINKGITNDVLAAEALETIWTLNNDTAKDAWADQEEAAMRQAQEVQCVAVEQEQECQQELEDKQAAAHK
ncbi:hypothetical protein EDB19DRAFT_1603050, partial [Suillus lakei]